MDTVELVMAILAGLFWPVAAGGLILDAVLWRSPGWGRARRGVWTTAFVLAVANAIVTIGFFAGQMADGFYMAVTWTPIAAIVLAWIVIGSWRRATRPLPDPEPAGG